MPATPLTIRWLNAVMDDPALAFRAKVAAVPLFRHADMATGKNCYPGAQRCADEMSVGLRTIQYGWGDLTTAGYLVVQPLPEGRRRTHGAVKTLTFPKTQDIAHQVHDAPSDAQLLHQPRSTYSGNGTSSPSCQFCNRTDGACPTRESTARCPNMFDMHLTTQQGESHERLAP